MRFSLCLALVFSVLANGFAAEAETLPKMRWDGHREAANWTSAALQEVALYDSKLASRVPEDIAAWCPGYATASKPDRNAFWVAVLAGLAKYESGFNPKASGGGRYFGLMQVSPKTAAAYRCEARSASALKDGSANLACAVKIIARQVGRDGVVAGQGTKGVARDWGPMRKARVRAEIAAWTAKQAYCKA
ncbi:transglycosylase SLT domain-containing protein [Cypionkella sp.]|uniref:lytic transglycosylase domain-containing protein n=1 Tax=Cypionkella sp. TaxID=2811411 RepID=UPI00276AFE9B|nr:transglycosylase SLT domain-containing protein [Cypionkella sp.]